MKITLLYQGGKTKKYKELGPENYCYIQTLYNEVPLYMKQALWSAPQQSINAKVSRLYTYM